MNELIKNIINQGEKINTEFKEAKTQLPKSLFETVIIKWCNIENDYNKGKYLYGKS